MEQKKTTGEKFRLIIDKLGTLVLMNLMFLVAALPIVTIGPAWSGLLTAVRHNIRGEKWFAGFRFGYKTRFWRSLILWLVMLVPCFYFATEICYRWDKEHLEPVIFSVLIFAMLGMFTSGMQILNVYVPTRFSQWMHNGLMMMTKGNIRVLVCAVIFWLPLFLLRLWPEVFFLILLIFIAIYFSLAALLTTMVLKENLVDFLLDARNSGELLAEEGRKKNEDKE